MEEEATEPAEIPPEEPVEDAPEAEPEPEPEPAPEEPAPEPPSPEPTIISHQDPLSLEFLYYGSVLKVVAVALTNEADKIKLLPWITKLFRPEYQASKLRDKRNRFLVALTVNVISDEVCGTFNNPPPQGALPDLSSIEPEPSIAASWEFDRMWQETLLAMPENFEPMPCCIHSSEEDCKQDHKIDKILDQEFQYLLYLARPYAALLSAEDKMRTAAWLQTLCTIHGEHCSSMKALRNDYLMALLGFLHDLRIVGPFTDYPPEKLERLDEAAKKYARLNPVIDPTSPEANEFLADQPVPDDGAFCYVALTGDLVASSF